MPPPRLSEAQLDARSEHRVRGGADIGRLARSREDVGGAVARLLPSDPSAPRQTPLAGPALPEQGVQPQHLPPPASGCHCHSAVCAPRLAAIGAECGCDVETPGQGWALGLGPFPRPGVSSGSFRAWGVEEGQEEGGLQRLHQRGIPAAGPGGGPRCPEELGPQPGLTQADGPSWSCEPGSGRVESADVRPRPGAQQACVGAALGT